MMEPYMTDLPIPNGAARGLRPLLVGFAVAASVTSIVVWGVASRSAASGGLEQEVQSNAIATVIAVHPEPGPGVEEVVLPGQIKGLFETPVYARTSGYVRSWDADIGAKVKAGQVLAVID